MEAIILAGGFGTRIRSVIGEMPKPMALVGGRPFLEWQIQYLIQHSIKRIILSVGYKHEMITSHFGREFMGCELDYFIENEPLGTGGAIFASSQKINAESFIALNGDSIAEVDFHSMLEQIISQEADLVMAGMHVDDMQRYGSLDFDLLTGKLEGFGEKGNCHSGFINAGAYALSKNLIKKIGEQHIPCSFEQDVVTRNISKLNIHVECFHGFFIDMGIPEDYERSQQQIPDFFSRLE